MMYSCALASSGSRKVVKRRGKSLRVDIHCHYLNTDAAAKVAHHNPAQFDFLARFSNDITRDVNAKQARERAARLTSIETRLKDMDRMGIDVQAIAPAPHQTYYWCEPGEGAELARTVNERLAQIVAATPERFVALGTVPLQDAGLAVAELEYGVKKLGLRGVEINPSV
ncbi:MAG: amidohydrolase, partial [Betaproteobacteria bacterium]